MVTVWTVPSASVLKRLELTAMVQVGSTLLGPVGAQAGVQFWMVKLLSCGSTPAFRKVLNSIARLFGMPPVAGTQPLALSPKPMPQPFGPNAVVPAAEF